jgi:hypothetical protein
MKHYYLLFVFLRLGAFAQPNALVWKSNLNSTNF